MIPISIPTLRTLPQIQARQNSCCVLDFVSVSPAARQQVMTPEQTKLIRQSFDEMWPIRRNLAVEFYDRFFEACPDARRLFPNDMEKQYLKSMNTIAALVGALDNHALFQSIISHTALQHARFWSDFITAYCVR